MRITKDTMRADGQTVGEAMEKDRQFLRSVGITPADERWKTPDEIHDDRETRIRGDVLDALDSALGGKGWIDSDLPELFKALDAQLKRWESRNL
jgi:hypothetical protein